MHAFPVDPGGQGRGVFTSGRLGSRLTGIRDFATAAQGSRPSHEAAVIEFVPVKTM
jgi:small ligand-binding sensory domain FIST